MKNLPDLKSCPFCGHTEFLTVGTGKEFSGGADELCNDFAVCCDYTRGGCGATCGYSETPEEAVDKWNRRAGQ